MKGNITRRGAKSWRIKFDIGKDPVTGKRRTQFITVKGSKKNAQVVLTRKLAEFADGHLIEQSTVTVAEYTRHWIEAIAPARTGDKTRERYREIIEKHIITSLG